MLKRSIVGGLLGAALTLGCAAEFNPDLSGMDETGSGTAGSGEGENTDATTASSTDASTDASTGSTTTSSTTSGDGDGGDGDGDGEDLPCGLDPDVDCPACEVPQHVPCDEGEELDAAALIGLGCSGEIEVSTQMVAFDEAWEARTSFGPTDTWDPTEGERYLVLGSGHTVDLDIPLGPETCSREFDFEYVWTSDFPAPIQENNAGNNCYLFPELVGTGDCSNSIQSQTAQFSLAYDYTEFRIEVTVPETVDQFSFDWAFLSKGIPGDVNSQWNDMFIVWLEAGNWTGNVALTTVADMDKDYAVSLNIIGPDPDHEPSAPALAGTCMAENGATDWRTAVAFLPPGDTVTIVFAVFDGADTTRDSYVFIDNFQWGCQG